MLRTLLLIPAAVLAAGCLTFGPDDPVSQTTAPPTVSATTTTLAPPPPATYEVQRGDTMISVAARFGITLTALARVNNIADPTLIYVGQTLLIPPPPDEADEPLLTIAPATDPALPSIQPTLAPTTTRLWG